MGQALAQAAAEAGIRLTLLDTCYLTGGLCDGRPVDGVQRRFSDGTAGAWAARVAGAARRTGAADRRGGALGAGGAARGAARRRRRRRGGRPLHVHLSEQPAENDACLAAYGLTPTGLLAAEGLLGPATTAVHATHLTGADVALLGGSRHHRLPLPDHRARPRRRHRPGPCACATPGARSRLGSDQHAVTDLLEEARGLEMHERLASGERGRFAPATLLDALTGARPPRLARRRAPGTRGAAPTWSPSGSTRRAPPACDPAQVLLAATAADVDTVVVDGRIVVVGRAARARRRRRAAAGRDRAAVGGR